MSLLSLFGYSKPIPLHDHTDSRQSLRSIEHSRSGDPLGDPTYIRHVDRVTNADERAEKTARLLRTRRSWAGAAAALLLAIVAPASGVASQVHLCPPDLCNGTTVLNPPLAPHRGVLDFLVSPTGERVFYRADISSDSKYELWTVPIGGGQSVKINAPLAFDYDVEGYEITSDGLTVVYRSGRTDSNDWKLYRARATGGQAAQISQPVTGSKPVDNDFRIAPGDLTVVYLLTVTARELYSTPIAAPHSTRISQDLVTGGNVMPGFSVDGDGHVRFRADARVNNRFEWWLGHIGGGPVLAEVFADGFEGGSVGAWQ